MYLTLVSCVPGNGFLFSVGIFEVIAKGTVYDLKKSQLKVTLNKISHKTPSNHRTIGLLKVEKGSNRTLGVREEGLSWRKSLC